MSQVELGLTPVKGVSDRAEQTHRPLIVVGPARGWTALNLRELWEYRDLVRILAGRDVKLRYRQTALGVIWVILQPLVAAIIFAVIFGHLARLTSDGSPYLLFVFCGLMPWNLFASVLQRGGMSLVGDTRLVQKVYFPRMLIPVSSAGACLIDFAVSFVVLLVFMAAYRVTPGWQILTVPGFLCLTIAGSLGIALWLAAFNVRYRDFMYALPFIIQVWMFATPVAYAGKIIPRSWQWLYSLNPAFGYVEGFRWALLGRDSLNATTLSLTVAISLLALMSGAFIFRRVERDFADVV
ncbi:MAG TPA: ABC transporter permease [Chloroflexota bacterium]|nr:ABC transporter permease [Chloroflexota bacterium]